jgi:hypothetical protein
MKNVNLKMPTVVTTLHWLQLLLGFLYCKNNKCYYTNGHEQADHVRYILEFIKRYFAYKFHSYRWVQLYYKDDIHLESLEKNHLKTSLGMSYTDEEGKAMKEYHFDSDDALKEFVNLENLPFGSNLSAVKFPEGERPLILVDQDESIIYQYLFVSKSWHCPEGEGMNLTPKRPR